MCQTAISRQVGTRIIREAAYIAVQNNNFNDKIMQAYFEIAQDPDITIKHDTLAHINFLLKEVTIEFAEKEFFPEVYDRI